MVLHLRAALDCFELAIGKPLRMQAVPDARFSSPEKAQSSPQKAPSDSSQADSEPLSKSVRSLTSSASVPSSAGGAASRYEVLASSVRLAASKVHSRDLMAATDDSLRERFVPHVEVGVKVPAISKQRAVLLDALPEGTAWLQAADNERDVTTSKGRQIGDLVQPNLLQVQGCVQFTGVSSKAPLHMVAGGSSNRPCRGGALAAALVHDRIQRLMYPGVPRARWCNFALPGEWQAVPLRSGRVGFALFEAEEEQAEYTPYAGASVHLVHWIASAWAFMAPAEGSSGDDAARASQLRSARKQGLAPRPFPVNEADTAAYDCVLCDGTRALLYRGVKRIRSTRRFTVSSALRQLATEKGLMGADDTFGSPLDAAQMADDAVRANQPHTQLRLVNFAQEPDEVQYLPCAMPVRSLVLQSLRLQSQHLDQ